MHTAPGGQNTTWRAVFCRIRNQAYLAPALLLSYGPHAMQYVAILNPAAGHGRVRRRREAIAAALASTGWPGTLRLTEAPGHAVELARQAAIEAEVVIAVGGDGTVHEVCRGLLASDHRAHLGVVPLGTGNDFVKMLGMPRRLVAAAQSLATAAPQAVDYGIVQWTEHGQQRQQPFVNAVGIGFDAQVAVRTAASKMLPGLASYLIAVLQTLRCWDGPHVRIESCTPDGARLCFDHRMLLVTAGNGVCSGGMFYLTPHASIMDGLLDVCIVENMPPTRLLQILPRALNGTHEVAREVHTCRVRSLRVTANVGLPVHADGEIVALNAQNVAIEVVPEGLSVLMPA